MSGENVEIVRRAIRHLNETGEPDWDLYGTDLVWTTRPDGPAHFTYRGLDGLRRGSRSMRQVWANLHGEILEVIESGGVVVSVIRWHLRGQSGVELDEVEGWVTCIRDARSPASSNTEARPKPSKPPAAGVGSSLFEPAPLTASAPRKNADRPARLVHGPLGYGFTDSVTHRR